MKEIKDFFEEIEKLEIAQGVIDINEAKRLVSEAYVAGINFQANQTKQGVKQIAQLNDILEYEISQPNELVNDWDICDWKFDYRHPFWKQFHTPAELKRFCCK